VQVRGWRNTIAAQSVAKDRYASMEQGTVFQALL